MEDDKDENSLLSFLSFQNLRIRFRFSLTQEEEDLFLSHMPRMAAHPKISCALRNPNSWWNSSLFDLISITQKSGPFIDGMDREIRIKFKSNLNLDKSQV